MFRRLLFIIGIIALMSISVNAFAYNFWGITMGTATYNGGTHLTFNGLANTNIQFAVGSYKYTKVDSTWYGAFPAASPGANYALHRKCDAQGIFFRPTDYAAEFVVITGMPQDGITAPECGYGTQREFGPGDLKIDIKENGVYTKTYGVGFRLDNLVWAVDPNTTKAEFKIHKATGGVDSIYARDAGTLGRVELNPSWSHVDHASMPAYDERGYAFFKKDSGTLVGNVNVTVEDTGVSLDGTNSWAYKVSVPWDYLGINVGDGFNMRISWRPDCGNDLISTCIFGSRTNVPEPGSVVALISGLVGLMSSGKRLMRRSK